MSSIRYGGRSKSCSCGISPRRNSDGPEWNVNDFDDPWVREQIEETYFEYSDYVEAYNKAKEMLEDASEKVKMVRKKRIYGI